MFFEVHNATGYGQRRSADAIVMNLWPSRGLAIHGMELKAHRSDWLKELRDPAKAEMIAEYCDYWWIVAAPDIVKRDEVPDGWGLMVLTGEKLRAVKDAPKKKAKVLDREFAAALLRRAHEHMESETLTHAQRHEEYQRGHKTGLSKSESKTEVSMLESKIQFLTREVDAYKEAIKNAGMPDFNSWEWPRIGKAVELVRTLGNRRIIAMYKRMETEMSGVLSNVRGALKIVEDEGGKDMLG